MRYPDLSKAVTVNNGATYTMGNMLLEFVWSRDWSQEEASVASFNRCKAALKKTPVAFEDRDFDRVLNMLRSVTFPPHVALELTELRNDFAFSPTEAPVVAPAA